MKNRNYKKWLTILAVAVLATGTSSCVTVRATGDLGIVIERATGSVQIIETTNRTVLGRVDKLGDLSHASVVYSRDQKYAYVFGRDGGLTKIDLTSRSIDKRVLQAGNSIGGAISTNGRLIAVSNYKPGGVRVFSAETLELVADIPATYDKQGRRSKVVGLVDAPGQKFVFSLFDAGEIWVADFSKSNQPDITKFRQIGNQPYDALISPEGRYYIAGLFGEDGLALLDLWHQDAGVKRILNGYGRGKKKLPVYKMPHLEGWAIAGGYTFVPAVGLHEVLVINRSNWREKKRIAVYGQPVFVMASPDQRKVWVNFAFPNNDTVQVIDTETLKVVKQIKPGKAVMHMEFTPRGEEVWVSVRDENLVKVYDTSTYNVTALLKMKKPSGIFMSARAHRIGL